MSWKIAVVVGYAHDVAAHSRAAAVSTFSNKVKRRQGTIAFGFKFRTPLPLV
jgi:hypothetical protein